MIYEEKTVVSIYEENDEKYIHYLGYGYYADSPPEKPYRFVEYTWLITSLEEALETGIAKWEVENQEFVKQYISDVTEDEMNDIYEHYDCGKMPKCIKAEDITADTPCGMYIVDMGY